jgi:hypothetical protein
MESAVPPIAALALPTDADTLAVLTTKLSSYLYVLHVKHDLAAATRSTFDEILDHTPEARARHWMTPHELDYFQAWKEGTLQRLPSIDWDNDHGRTPTSKQPMKRALRRAAALNRIYQTDKAQPCHYIFFAEQHSCWLPLVAAIARIIGAETNQKQSLARTSSRGSQVRTLDKIVQMSRRVLSQSEESLEKKTALEKIRYLDEAKKNLQRKQQNLDVCLGKRKYEQGEVLAQRREVRDIFTSQSVEQYQHDLENEEAGPLPWRLKLT